MQTAAMVERNHVVPADFSPLYLLPTRPLGFVNGPAPFITDLTEDEWGTLTNEAGEDRLFEIMEERVLDVMKSFVREYVPTVLGFIVGGPSLVVCCFLIAFGTPVACVPLPLLVAIVSTILFQTAIWLDPLEMLTPVKINCFGKNIV